LKKQLANGKKKSRRTKQRHCCRWSRSCITNKKGLQRNCHDGAKTCKWVGFIIRKSIKRLCNFKPVGKFGRRKFCCNHFRKCHGKKCKVSRKGCKFFGPTYSRTPSSSCHWKALNKKQKRRRCCYWNNYCVDSKCTETKRHCRFVGSIITVSTFRKCYWKQIEENGKPARRQECCTLRRIRGSRGSKKFQKNHVNLLVKVFF